MPSTFITAECKIVARQAGDFSSSAKQNRIASWNKVLVTWIQYKVFRNVSFVWQFELEIHLVRITKNLEHNWEVEHCPFAVF